MITDTFWSLGWNKGILNEVRSHAVGIVTPF